MEGSAKDGSAEGALLGRLHSSKLKVRRLGWCWPVAIIAAVLYGSCVPFDFRPEVFTARGGFGVPAIGLHASPADPFEDITTNLLVYMPIGLTLVLYGRFRRLGWLSCLVVAVLIGTGVSVLAETLQTSVASRVASWLDVLVNSVGTAVGAVLGATLYGPVVSAVRRLRTGFADRPFTTVASLLVFGLFFYRLAPFDFITDTDGLRDSFLRAVWTIPEKCTAPSGAPPYAALIDQLVLAAWFAGLGYVLALSGREAGRRCIPATASAIQQGCIIVVVTELMQLFTRSHVFDIATIVIGSLAVVFGAWFAIFVVDAHTRSAWKDRPDGRSEPRPSGSGLAAAVPTPVLLTLIVFQVGVLLASSIDPHVLSLGDIDLSQVEWTPFEVLWRRPTLDAAGDVLSTLIIYSVLATTLVVALHRARIARVRLITAVAVTTLALVVEGLHTATMTHAADITGPMLALSASAGPLGGWLGSAFSQLPSAA